MALTWGGGSMERGSDDDEGSIERGSGTDLGSMERGNMSILCLLLKV